MILDDKLGEVEKLLREGLNVVEVSERLSVSINALRNALKISDIDVDLIKKEVDDATAEKIKSLVNEGLTTNQIYKRLGISFQTIRSFYDRYDIAPVERNNHYVKEELKSYIEEGLTFEEISQKYYNCVDPSAILSAAKRLNLIDLYKPISKSKSIGEYI